MSEWYEQPYPTGPVVAVKGFPRPLYPPDASTQGKKPSADGPDVKAYKITIQRLGRWPLQTYDDTYSNGFAHGTGGNVVNTGMEGFQRQQKITASGWIGKATFDSLRAAKIPAGLPNAGQMAMSPAAVNLINQAYDLFGGEEPGPMPPLRRKLIPSPNYSSRGGAGVRLIVIHTAEGARTIEDLGNFFARPSSGVSSHAGADDQRGVVGIYVRRQFKAWTAAQANPVAVQIELCGFARWSRDEWMRHTNMLENCARWISEEADNFNIPITKLSGTQARTNGRGVCQHSDLGDWGGGHWDCGTGFPMDYVLDMARRV